MGNWSVESSGGKVSLVFTEEDVSRPVDMVSVGMLVNNDIDYFAKCSFYQIDDVRKVVFDISGLAEYKKYISADNSYSTASVLLISAAKAFADMKKYMMSADGILKSVSSIYVNEREQTVFHSMPVK